MTAALCFFAAAAVALVPLAAFAFLPLRGLMSHPTRSTRMRIETMRACERCGDPFIGPKVCRLTDGQQCEPAIPPAPETRVPCPAPSLPCSACGAEPGDEHEWVPCSTDEAWRAAHGHEPRSRNSSRPTQRKT